MADPVVSIGLPVYNGERYLELALDSLLAQTFEDFELIVSDNGSSDRTEEICRGFAVRDARIRYHRAPENRGASWNFNRVFELSRGVYFKWHPHDDLVMPTWLERCVQTLAAAPPSVILCYTRTRVIDENGDFLWDYDGGRVDTRGQKPYARLRAVMRHNVWSEPLFNLIRSDALRRTRLLGAYLSSDYILLGELALLGAFQEIPEILYIRREHERISRRAHPNPSEALAWFDPSKRGQNPYETTRLFLEYLEAIKRSPLSLPKKATTYVGFFPALVRHKRHGMQHDLVRYLKCRSAPALKKPDGRGG